MKSQIQIQQKGFFGGRYDSTFTKYEGFDFSRHCFVFPGQSAAFPGMMKDELGASAAALEVFKRADDLSQKLQLPPVSDYVFNPGRLSTLDKSILRNPALFTAQVALSEHLKSVGLTPSLVTGHSFGEYAAVVVSGIGRFEDVFEIVVTRDRVSPEPKSMGVMIVAGATPAETATALQGIEHYISNLNSPEQVVVSVRPTDEARTLAAFKSIRVAAKTLQEMPQPYHTPWMEPVSIELEKFIESRGFKFGTPHTPIISSVHAELLDTANFNSKIEQSSFARRLARQVQVPVFFPDQLTLSLKQNVLNFIEVGPGEICSSFIKKTLGETLHKVTPLKRYMASEKKKSGRVVEAKASTLGLLSKVISAVTGYNVEEISISDNFQEDLGIDSIRKAEIVFKFMESMSTSGDPEGMLQVNLTQLKRVEDVLEHFENISQHEEKAKKRSADFTRFCETWTPEPVTDFDRLNQNHWPVTFFDLNGAPPKELPEKMTVALVAPKGTVVSDVKGHFDRKVKPWLEFFQSLGTRRFETQVALLTEEESDPYFAGFSGLLKCLLREDLFLTFRHIEGIAGLERGKLEEIVREEFCDYRFTDVRYENGQRFAKRWEHRGPEEVPAIRNKPVVVSFGGARGIGSEILAGIARKFDGAKIYFSGRSSLESETVQSTLKKLSHAGADASYIQTDVTSAGAVETTLRKIAEAHGEIDVLLNAAGQEFSRSLATKSESEIWEEFSGKVSPISAIVAATRELKILHLINFSSIAASFGSPGQTIYALGNETQVLMGKHCASSTKVTSLVLPPWDNLGMTEKENILIGLKAGAVALLEKEVGVGLVIDEILARQTGSIAFLDRNDLRAYDREITDRRAWEGLFSQAFSANVPMRLKTLNLKDQSYLNDHKINGTVIYPGSSGLAMMFYVGYHFFKRAPRIENFEVKSFLAPDADTSTCELEVKQEGPGRLRMQLSSKRIVHFIAEVVDVDQQTASRTNRETLAPFKISGQIIHEPLYDNNHIRFGPHFQLVNSLYFNKEREVLMTTRQTKFMSYTPSRPFDRLQQWFESTLQVMGCQLLWNTRHYWVPNRIKSLTFRIDQPIFDQQVYRTQLHRVEKGLVIADAFWLDSKNRSVIEIRGIEAIDVGEGHHETPTRHFQDLEEIPVLDGYHFEPQKEFADVQG